MSLLVDSDVIRGERGTFDLSSWLETQAGNTPQIAAITVAELWNGVQRATASHHSRREAYLTTTCRFFPTQKQQRWSTHESGPNSSPRER